MTTTRLIIFYAAISLAMIYSQCSPAHAYELEIYDSRANTWEVIIEVKNDCGETHKLVVSKEAYASDDSDVSDWVIMAMDFCKAEEVEGE